MKRFTFFFLVLLASACSSSDNYAEIAQRTCDCIRPTYEIAQELQSAVGTTDTTAMMGLQARLMGVMQEGETCTNQLAEDYPEVDQNGEQADQILAEMKKICPEIMQVAMPGEMQE